LRARISLVYQNKKIYSCFDFPGKRNMEQNRKPITQILQECQNGKRESLDEFLPVVYDELRRLAKSHLKRERENHTLQPTALVHEAYLRLLGQTAETEWQNRAHFFGIAARLMREILIEYARMKNRQKRGGGEYKTQITLDAAVSFSSQKQFDITALDEALTELGNLDERQARIVEMKFFGGMNVEEIAAVLEISPATVKREWASAKLLLYRMLGE
jgi:RNA polymerase sigma-70 factor, ECF subfamily